MSAPSQLLLLADHLKLSLLERSRALASSLTPNTSDSSIARSLDSLAKGIAALDPSTPELPDLQSQYDALAEQFNAGSAQTPLQGSMAAPAEDGRRDPMPRSVRFTDTPPTYSARDALFPYRDDPDEDALPDHADFSNQQIHQYHQDVMAEQDSQLDALGHSIGRQRELSLAIGEELDEQMLVLDEVDERVDRHQSKLDGAARRLGRVARSARENWSCTAIVVLVVVLVLLIIITK